jgi:hypothetical protein
VDTGYALRQILDRHKELDPRKCVVQDREDVIGMAEVGYGVPEGVVFMVHDFRREQVVRGLLDF